MGSTISVVSYWLTNILDIHKISSLIIIIFFIIISHVLMSSVRLWLRGRASVLIPEGCWFDSPGVHVEVSLGKILNSKLLLMCWSAPCMKATTISVWIAVSRFGQKRDKCPIMNKYNFSDNYILIAVWWDSDNLWIDWFPSKTLPSLLGFLQLFFVCLFVCFGQ